MSTFWKLLKTLGWLIVGFVGSLAFVLAANWYATYQYPVDLPSSGDVNVNLWDQGYALAHGTWIIDNTKSAFPVRNTRILCDRSGGVCTVASADIVSGLLYVESEWFKISSWTSSSLTFVDDSPTCVRTVYMIDRTNKRAIGTRKLKEPMEKVCSLIEKKIMSLTLGDGSKVVRELREAELSRAMPYAVAGLTLWAAFVIVRIVRVWRRREPRPQ